MELFLVSFDRFLEEIQHSQIKEGDRNVIEREELEDRLVYYLVPIGLNKIYVFIVLKKEITPIHKANLDPISKPAKRINDNFELRNISNSLQRLEEEFKKGTIRERVIEKEVEIVEIEVPTKK